MDGHPEQRTFFDAFEKADKQPPLKPEKPTATEKDDCQYCEDTGPCRYCDRGKRLAADLKTQSKVQ